MLLRSKLFILLCQALFCLDFIWASNYDSYIARLMDDGRNLHRDFIQANPNAQLIFDRLNSPPSKRLTFQENEADDQYMTDPEWSAFLREWADSKREILGDDEFSDRSQRGSESPLTYLPNEDDLPESELALRRNEVAYQNQLWGEHKVSGGSGEIGQWLDYALLGAGAQDNDTTQPDGLSELMTSNVHNAEHEQIKMDNLPAYCDPPNPCPLNYDPDKLATPCDKGIENTIEFNREWIRQKMINGECTCDSEHMLSCPDPVSLRLGDDIFRQGLKFGEKIHMTNPYLRGQKRKRLVPKKRFKRSWHNYYNPYLMGKPHRSAVKKTGNYPPLPRRAM